jgi:hypothetical protein
MISSSRHEREIYTLHLQEVIAKISALEVPVMKQAETAIKLKNN